MVDYAQYEAAVVEDSPLIRYHFNTAPLSNTGSLSLSQSGNLPSRAGGGPLGSIYGNFTGSEAIVLNGNVELLNDRQWALDCWFKASSAHPTDYKTLFRRSYGGVHMLLRVRGPNLGTEHGPGTLEVYYSSDTWAVTFRSPVRVDNDVWRHTVLTTNGSFLYMYIDGQLVNSAPVPAGGNLNQYNAYMAIGRGLTGDLNEQYIGGMDEFAFYNQHLTQERIDARLKETVVIPPFRGWGLPL